MQVKFNLEIGNTSQLSGNAVIYWEIINKENKINPSINFIAVNFVVSVFMLDDNLITATFPPVGFQDREEFMLYIRQSRCDLIYAGEITLKNDADYLKNLPDNEYFTLNKIIDHYLALYREKIETVVLNLSLKEKIYMLKKMLINIRKDMSSRSKKIKIPVNRGKLMKLLNDMKNYFNPLDVEIIMELLPIKGKTAERAVFLYVDKFISIFYENYEETQKITDEIEKIQKKLSLN